ncbi:MULTISPECIES: pyridoxal phosphate-dependent aminotransferase [Ramlibacter]|uniref:Pyridoxal phosphate-dependent aminotransferase n=1 Tax=Ramlibacter aquaticus TaxID=2780094 RepID=A0ABR9SF90_9BURK|nr:MULTISPECIES: pyridoxal phosphate-dependent aminotransferase [Ramlibacter]MBE7941033.1 pyridoxal phosphate-dependent aminotransferase [Ramlibacter aquaticus]
MESERVARVHTPALQTKLPEVGTTIFTVMSALAAEHGAVNLGQGFPDFDCDPALVQGVNAAMLEGLNQYPPMAGVAPLRTAVAAKLQDFYGRRYDTATEITITAGATQAIITAVLAVVRPGDEVIVLEPCYDSYVPNIALAGGTVVRVPLTPHSFRPDFDRIAAAITPRTRAILVNTPHNPSGTCWSAQDMGRLEELLAPTEVLVISDEVYEHMVFDGREHQSIARFPGLAARGFIVSSFGKTFHVTGWKVGYVAAPAALTAEFRKVHQFNVFTVNTPVQHGIARYMADPAPARELPAFYQRKRDLFREGLARTRLDLLPCEGTYFQCADISRVSDLSEPAFCEWLVREIGVAAIPMSAFYGGGFEQRVVRFCFAKKDETLRAALGRLARL